jgi:hypothetical protein
MLTYNDERRFYIRGDGGKRPMDYEDVRDGFLGGENIAARIRNWRMERCAAILNGETPQQLAYESVVVIHVVPFDAIAIPHRFDARTLQAKQDKLLPLRHHSYGHDVDLDGVFALATRDSRLAYSYSLLSHSGAIEGVDGSWLAPWRDDKGKAIPFVAVEGGIIQAVEGYLGLLGSLEISPPYAVFLTSAERSGALYGVRSHLHAFWPANKPRPSVYS